MQPRHGDEVTHYNADGGAKPFLDAPPSRWTRGDYRGNSPLLQALHAFGERDLSRAWTTGSNCANLHPTLQ
jgi:hypothetical protein